MKRFGFICVFFMSTRQLHDISGWIIARTCNIKAAYRVCGQGYGSVAWKTVRSMWGMLILSSSFGNCVKEEKWV